jgi:hypothetical protein
MLCRDNGEMTTQGCNSQNAPQLALHLLLAWAIGSVLSLTLFVDLIDVSHLQRDHGGDFSGAGAVPGSSGMLTTGHLVTLGVGQTLASFLSGFVAEAHGRRTLHAAGWLVGLGVPAVILLSKLDAAPYSTDTAAEGNAGSPPSTGSDDMVDAIWSRVVWCNLLLGIQQGVCRCVIVHVI